MTRDDRRALHAMNLDDAYVVERQLASGVDGVTELVSLEGAGPFVRKRIPLIRARRMVWAALAECGSPYLPRIYATYEMPDEFVAVYGYVVGKTLDEVMGECGRLPLAEVGPIIAKLCEAVFELHEHGVIHADIAPRNVVLAQDGPHLIDFGIARMVFDKPSRDERAWGTRGFAAPEQHGFAALDVRSDIYAIGRLAGYLLTGAVLSERSFEGELRCSGVVPEGVCQVLGRACAFEPSARFQTVEELGRAFAMASCGETMRDEGTPAAESASTDTPSLPDAPPDFTKAASSRASRLPVPAIVAAVLVVAIAFGVWLTAGGALHTASSGLAEDDQEAVARQRDPLPSDTATDGGLAGLAADGLVDEAVESLKITESSWFVGSTGYVYYAVAVANVGEDVTALFPSVLITGRDASGSVVFSDTQVLSTLYPGETWYWAGQAGNGDAPASVEISLARPGSWEVERGTGELNSYAVSGVTTSTDQFGSTVVTGEMTLESRGTGNDANGLVAVVAIGRDAQGKMAWGEVGFVSEPDVGGTVPFEITALANDLPAYETVEVHAYPW